MDHLEGIFVHLSVRCLYFCWAGTCWRLQPAWEGRVPAEGEQDAGGPAAGPVGAGAGDGGGPRGRGGA